jgi:hypothetical protein
MYTLKFLVLPAILGAGAAFILMKLIGVIE